MEFTPPNSPRSEGKLNLSSHNLLPIETGKPLPCGLIFRSENKDAGNHITSEYRLGDFITQFEKKSHADKEEFTKTYSTLVASYRNKAKEIADKSDWSANYGRRFFNESHQEYNEAFCIIYLAIASDLGIAEASFELAKIYREGKYFLPQGDIDCNDSKAIEFATKAQNQGDADALYNLGDLYEKDSFFGYGKHATSCYTTAANDYKHEKAKAKLAPDETTHLFQSKDEETVTTISRPDAIVETANETETSFYDALVSTAFDWLAMRTRNALNVCNPEDAITNADPRDTVPNHQHKVEHEEIKEDIGLTSQKNSTDATNEVARFCDDVATTNIKYLNTSGMPYPTDCTLF